MNIIYKNALVEVNEALKHTDIDLVNRIPIKFKNFIQENMSKTFEFTILENEEPRFSKEAQSILSLIYRNYFCSKEEKSYLMEYEKQIRNENNKFNF